MIAGIVVSENPMARFLEPFEDLLERGIQELPCETDDERPARRPLESIAKGRELGHGT
jgi:hypothetical protein